MFFIKLPLSYSHYSSYFDPSIDLLNVLKVVPWVPLIVNFLNQCQIYITVDFWNNKASFFTIPFIYSHLLFREKLLDKSGTNNGNIINGSRNSTIDAHNVASMKMINILIFKHMSLILHTLVIFFVLGWFLNRTSCYIKIIGVISGESKF